jgi:hypothetical protein
MCIVGFAASQWMGSCEKHYQNAQNKKEIENSPVPITKRAGVTLLLRSRRNKISINEGFHI